MINKSFAIAVSCVLFAAACNRDAEPEIVTPPAAPAATAAGSDTGMVADAPAPIAAEKPFEMKDFAGTFSAEGSTVSLNADGSYALKLGDAASDGTWTADAAGSEILLDPHSKSGADRKYAVVSRNEIRALDGGARLQREGAAK